MISNYLPVCLVLGFAELSSHLAPALNQAGPWAGGDKPPGFVTNVSSSYYPNAFPRLSSGAEGKLQCMQESILQSYEHQAFVIVHTAS